MVGAWRIYCSRCRAVTEWWESKSAAEFRAAYVDVLARARRARRIAREEEGQRKFLATRAPRAPMGGAYPNRARSQVVHYGNMVPQMGEDEELQLYCEEAARRDRVRLPWY